MTAPFSGAIDVQLFDHNYTPMGKVPGYLSCSVTFQYMGAGAGTLVVAEDDPAASLLMSVGDSGVVPVVCTINGTRWSGRVSQGQWQRQGPPGTGTVTATLIDEWAWLRSMLASQNGSNPALSSMPLYDTQTGAAATVAAYYINTAASRISTSLGVTCPVLAVAPASDGSAAVTLNARMQNLSDLLTDALTTANVAMPGALWLPGDPQPANTSRVLSTATVVFSPHLVAPKPWLQWSDFVGGITGGTITVTAPTANAAVLGMAGQDAARSYFEYRDVTAQGSDGGYGLPEGYADATDVSDTGVASARGAQELAKFRSSASAAINVQDGVPWSFGPAGYQVGDLATLQIGPIGQLVERVSRVTVTDDRQAGLVYAPVVGDPTAAASSDELIVRAVSNIAQQLRLLQTGR